jgi:Kef-type K+ transport system membrane component KefB
VELLKYVAPHGTAWELLLAVVIIVVGPIAVERIRIPGMIGLLAGGCIIGPNVLNVVSAHDGVVHEFGEVGLLYLMFVAGLELDFNVFARYRRQAAIFSIITFSIPMLLGFAAGLLLNYGTAASLLLGSLFASYTLVVYPIVRNLGLSSNGAVATTVGATVITDTLALVVLAAVAGSATGDANGVELGSQIVLGLAVLGAFCFLVLPRLGAWFFAGIGSSRMLRYGFVLAALLAAGVLAEVVGIEAIVGAFFAGLALNRLVPNEGEFMERIEFFGSALLVPIFLVSVGTVIDPTVLVDPATLGVAAVFTVACVGGKLAAAVLCRPLFGFSPAEVGVVFGLSVAQAAATLAATFVGLQIGLFTTTTVNAVMIVIVVSLVAASMSAQRFGRPIPQPEADTTLIGRCVLTHVGDASDMPVVLGIAAQVARVDAGIVRPVAIVADGGPAPDGDALHDVHQTITKLGIDAELDVRHDRSVNDGILHAASSYRASLLVLSAAAQSWLPTLLGAAQHSLVASSVVPTVLVRPGPTAHQRVVLVLAANQARRPSSAAFVSARLATKLRTGDHELLVVAGRRAGDPAHRPAR